MAVTKRFTKLAGATIQRRIAFGVLGTSYLGSDSLADSSATVLLKELAGVRRTGALASGYEESPGPPPALRGEIPSCVSLGVLCSGSRLQLTHLASARTTDRDAAWGSQLRSMDLAERVLAFAALGRRLEGVESAPYLCPWNLVLDASGLRFVEAGLAPDVASEFHDPARYVDDVLLFWAPEVQEQIVARRDAPAQEAATVYALAAAALAVFRNRTPALAASAGPEGEGLDRRRQILGGRGLEVPIAGLGPKLAALLRRGLRPNPSARPSLSAFVRALERLGATGPALAEPPPPVWSNAVLGALALLALFGASGLKQPAPELEAMQRFADASTLSPEQRQGTLEGLKLRLQDGEHPLPEAQRLLAIDAYHAWLGGAESDLGEVLAGLEERVISGYEDDLAQQARFTCGALLRWHVGDPRGDRLLEAVANTPSASPALRTLARATRHLSLTRSEGETDLAWLSAAQSAGAELDAPLPVADYTGGPDLPGGKRPGTVALRSGWIARLVQGRLLELGDDPASAQAHYVGAHGAARVFLTQAALGIALVARGSADDRREGEELLLRARSVREAGELHLVVGQRALREGHLDQARQAFRLATKHPSLSPRESKQVQAAAEAGIVEVEFLEISTLARGKPALARKRLEAFLARADEPAYARLATDATLAHAQTLDALGQRAEAARPLWALLNAGRLDPGWPGLPTLSRKPPTRSRSRVVELLLRDLCAQLEARFWGQLKDKGALLSLADVQKRERSLRLGEDTPPARELLQAWVRLLKLKPREAPSVGGLLRTLVGIEATTPALRASVLRATAAALELGARSCAGDEGALSVLASGVKGLRERSLGAKLEAYKQGVQGAQLRVDRALLRAVQAFVTRRSPAWKAIEPEAPRYSAARAEVELNLLKLLPSALGPKSSSRDPLVLARLAAAHALISWSRSTPEAFGAGLKAARHALRDLSTRAETPAVATLRKRLHLCLALAVRRASPKLRAGAGLKTPRALVRDHLAKACGTENEKELLEVLAEDSSFVPSGPEGRHLSPLYWLGQSHLEQAEAAAKAKQSAGAQHGAHRAQTYFKVFERGLKATKASPPPGAEGWATQLKRAGTLDREQQAAEEDALENALENAGKKDKPKTDEPE